MLVVDEHGSLEGIVTEGDILQAIVADIEEDEGLRIVQRDDGSLLIDGGYPFEIESGPRSCVCSVNPTNRREMGCYRLCQKPVGAQ